MAPSGYGDNRFLGLEPFGRYSHETSVTAGMLCLFGMINLVPGVYDLCVSTTDGQDWSGDSDDYPPVVVHLGALIQVGSWTTWRRARCRSCSPLPRNDDPRTGVIVADWIHLLFYFKIEPRVALGSWLKCVSMLWRALAVASDQRP